MSNYKNSNYALNKHSEGIVYKFADEIVEISLTDYLASNPTKTEADFLALKELSDSDYHQEAVDTLRQTRQNVPFATLEEKLIRLYLFRQKTLILIK